jgi:hemolysin activation/secretion protein
MADRAQLLKPLSEDEQWKVTAYLVALSPRLQLSTQQLRDEQDRRSQSKQAAQRVAAKPEDTPYDPTAAQALFEAKCSQCHKTNLVDMITLESEEDARDLVSRMVDEGLEATESELSQIVRHLTETYVKPSE